MNDSCSLVLDTNIFIHYLKQENDFFESCQNIIVKLLDEKFTIVIDYQNKILTEYNNQLKLVKPSSLKRCVEKIFTKGLHKRLFVYVEGLLEEDLKDLIDNGFHKHDLIFVQVAPFSSEKLIISTDTRSFLDENYKKWILDHLKIKICDPIEYLNENSN